MITRLPAPSGVRLFTTRTATHHPAPLSITSQRHAHSSASSVSRIPPPTPFVPDVPTFLKLVGRDCKQYESKIASWEVLFGSSSRQLRALGIEPPRTRKYLLHWRERFRRGNFGVWGTLKHVEDGVAELRVVKRDGKQVVVNTALSTLGRAADAEADAELQSEDKAVTVKEAAALLAKDPADAVPAKGAKVGYPSVVSGPYCHPVKGTAGQIARITAIEGMWEHKRGYKVGGGERTVRRAKTLSARRRRGSIVT